MSGTMSKRAAARNEKALQELVHSVPGNNLCADCAARNPAWASWSLGIFLCMRCAAIHRKLGTHISKVKSLSMDSWSNEQVDNMRKVGNVASNKIYNPQNKKPPVPIDADEADSAMERFIRAKYMGNGLKKPKRNSTGSTVSEEGTPPPLPPKNTSKFGLRSASSFLSLSGRKKDKGSNPPSRDGATSPRPSTGSLSPRRNKPSKVFGAAVDYDVGDDMEQKLRKLKDMGFTDEQRNLLVLNGMHGNMEKTVEALVRLGEGSTPTEPKPPRALTPTPITSTGGLSLNPTSPLYDARPASASTNPFDNIKPAPPPPQSSQSTGTMPNSTNPFLQPGTQSTNPFGVPTQQDPDLIAQAFSGMSLAPQQVLFPHHTGPMPPQQTITQPYQQSMTPPVYSTANFAAMSFNSTQTYPPPSQPLQPQNTGYNPFLQNASPKANPLAVQTAGVQNTFGNNPFTRSPTRLQSPSPLAQIPETIQQNIYYTPQPAPPQQSPSTNPFLHTPMSAPLQMPNPYQQPPQPQGQPQIQQQQQLYQQQIQQQIQQPQNPFQQQNIFGQQQQYQQPVAQPPKADKASIMALFNYPQLAPQQPAEAGTSMNGQGDLLGLGGQPAAQGAPQTSAPQRSVSTPLPGNNNPFHNMTSGASAAIPDPSASTSSKSSVPRSEEKIPGMEPLADIGSMPGIGASLNAGVGLMRGVGGSMGHGGGMGVGGMAGVGGPKRQSAMRDSVSLGMDMGWSNGRHSPDAFASLSARAGR